MLMPSTAWMCPSLKFMILAQDLHGIIGCGKLGHDSAYKNPDAVPQLQVLTNEGVDRWRMLGAECSM